MRTCLFGDVNGGPAVSIDDGEHGASVVRLLIGWCGDDL